MRALGLELRKTGTISNLYKDVDLVLNQFNIQSNTVSGNMQVATIAHALQKMIVNNPFFSVCTIDNCAKVGKIVISNERQQIYNAIHCMHWNQMTPEYRQAVQAMILDDFRTILNP